MAKILDKSTIVSLGIVRPWHVSQSVDAFTGIDAYDITISGSLTVTGSTNIDGDVTANSFTGSLYGTSSWAENTSTASYASSSVSSSYATSASYADTSTSASYADIATSSSYALSSSYADVTISSSYALSSSYSDTSTSASYTLSSSTATSASYSDTSVSSSYSDNSTSASYSVSSSYSDSTLSASYADNSTSSSYAVSASYSVTASYSENSTSASYADTSTSSSYSQNSTSASYALSSSYALTASYSNTATSASYALSASYAPQSVSSSYALSASYAVSASYAATTSFSERTTQTDVLVLNQSGYTITKGMVVRITGSNNASDIPRVVSASYENDNNSANTLGIATANITNGNQGYVITEGVLTGVDTSNYTSGQLIYLGATGSITGSAPIAPLHAVRLGEVVREQSNNGSIYVRIDNGQELGELHDVKDTTTTSSYGDLLVKSGSVWTNSRQLTGSYGLTGSLTATSFIGNLTGSAQSSISSSYAATASYVNTLNQDVLITGSLTVLQGATIYGSSSFQYVTSSQLAVSASFISVNVFEPAERFGGLKVYDSGSSTATASLAWDSLHNHWVYQNVSGASYTGGMLLSGPRNTGSLGDEPNLTQWFVPRSDGGDHLNDSQIYTSASITIVTGSLSVTSGVTASLLGTSSYSSQALSSSYALVASSTPTATSSSYALNATSASYSLTSSFYQETDPIFVARSASLATTGSNTFVGNQTIQGLTRISGTTSADLVRITSTGTGNAFVVEDDTNPDATPFVIDNVGNVSIGTTTPYAKLDISPLDGVDGILLNASPISSSQSARLMFGSSVTASNTPMIFASSGNLQIHTGGTPHVSSGTTKLFISSSGNIGIGTSNPTLGTLQVNGNVYANSFTGSFLGTASYASNALTSSYALTASYALTPPTWTAKIVSGSNYTASLSEFILVSASSHTVLLPAASSNAKVAVKWIVAPTTASIKTSGSGVTIDGTDRSTTGLGIYNQWDAYSFISDGTNWYIMG